MRKVASIFSILFCIFVLTASTSKKMMERITNFRQSAPAGAWWGERPWDKGDLVRMAYLEGMSRFVDQRTPAYTKAGAGKRQINLYIYGDSYVKDIPDSAYYGLHSFHFGRRNYTDLTYETDTTHTNVLIIELGERFVRDNLNNAQYIFDHVYRAVPKVSSGFIRPPGGRKGAAYAAFGPSAIRVRDFFNPVINQNIEYNLFSYNLFTPIRAFKAEMNARLFHRGSGDVAISDDGTRLFLQSTLAANGPRSAVQPISEGELTNIIDQTNRLYEHYRSEGFDAVYLSIVPSPVSLIQPDYYNHLLPDIQNSYQSGRLKMPFIDVFDAIKQTGQPAAYYLRGDSHWNGQGELLWISKVNGLLKTWDSVAIGRQVRQ